jgi:hypothetical protein
MARASEAADGFSVGYDRAGLRCSVREACIRSNIDARFIWCHPLDVR